MSGYGSQYPVFDLSSLSEVIWDEELQQLEMDDPLECKHTMFKAAVSTSDAQKVLDEMPSVVLWDEDRPPELHMNSDLLLQLAQSGEDLIDDEKKPTTELFFIDEFYPVHNTSFISGLADDAINEVFTERPLDMVIWDEAIDQVLLDDGKASSEQIAAKAQSVSKDTAHKVFREIATEIMCDEGIEYGNTFLRQECSASEVFDRLPQQGIAQRVFDVMPHMDVIWDEQLLLSPNSEDDLLLLLSEPATIAEFVEFMDQVTPSRDAKEAFYHCKVSECASVKVFNRITLPYVVWDQEPQHGPKSHGLLLQLASGEKCLYGEFHVDDDDKLRVNTPMEESVICDLLIHNINTSFSMEATIAHADEWQQDVVSYDNLSKLVAHVERSVGMDSKTVSELVNLKLLMATKDSPGELFDETHCIDDSCEEDGFNSHGILQQISQGIDDQMHDKLIYFKAFLLADCDALNVFHTKLWTDILYDEECNIIRSIVKFDANQKLAMGMECLNGEKMIFGAGIHALRRSDLPFASSSPTYSSSLRSQYCGLHHRDAAIALLWRELRIAAAPTSHEYCIKRENWLSILGVQNFQLTGHYKHQSIVTKWEHVSRLYDANGEKQDSSCDSENSVRCNNMREVSLCSLEKCGFAATHLLLGSSSSLIGFSQCSNDTQNVLDQVPAWWNHGLSLRASAQLRLPKRRYVPGKHQIREEASEFVGEGPLFSSGQKLFEQKSIWNKSCIYGHVQYCSLRHKLTSGQLKVCSAGACQKTQSPIHVTHGMQVVDRAFKYTLGIGVSLSNSASCSIRQWDPGGNSARCSIWQWDPGGNHDCFIPAIAWGQAMFCGGGIVTPCTPAYMGLDVIGFKPCGFVLATLSGGYIGEKLEIEKNRQYFRNSNRGLEGDFLLVPRSPPIHLL